MKFLEALRHLAATAMMLVVTFAAINFCRTLDRRQAALETRLTQAVGALNQSLFAQVHAELHPVSEQATGLLADLRGKLNTLDVDALNQTVSRLDETLKPIARSAAQIDRTLPDFLDCQQDSEGIGNKNCLMIRYNDLSHSADVTLQAIATAAPGIAHSAETASEAVAQAAPAVSGNAASISASASRIAATADRTFTELTKPKTLRQKIESWLKFSVYAASRFL